MAPLPINLTSQIDGDFICNATKPYYAFFCTLYGTDLIWYLNDKRINSFQSGDPIGRLFQTSYPELPEKPLYNITTVLTQLDNTPVNYFNAPLCISTLTVQPFGNDNDFSIIPFSVSCRTHCIDMDRTEICQTENYNIAGIASYNNIDFLALYYADEISIIVYLLY